MKNVLIVLFLCLLFPMSGFAQQTATQPFTLEVLGVPLEITTTSLPTANLGIPYSTLVVAQGGMPPYVWRVSAGSLPPGIFLDVATGELAGTATTVGLFSFELEVADSSSIPPPPPPPPTGFEGLIIRNGDLGVVGTGFGFLSSNQGGLGIAASNQTFAADQYSEGIVSADKPLGGHFGLFVRRNPSNGQRYNCVWGLPTSTDPNGFFLLKLDGLAGAPTLATVPAAQVPVGGDVLRIEARGTVISCLFNGVEIITVSNSALSGGELGMVMSLASQAEIPVPPSELPFPVFESWSGGEL